MSLRRFLIALSICAASSTCAHANTLHSYCLSGTCLDNGTVTPTTSNPARFGFGEAHPVDSGLLWIVELAPNNSASAATLSGTHTTLSSVTGVQYGQSAWTTGKLDSYLKGQFSKFTPSSPISAYLPTTQSLDAAATGYDVYLFNFGSYNYGKATGDPQFAAEGPLPIGSLFLAVLTNINVDKNGVYGVKVATPQSAALFEAGAPKVDAMPKGAEVPEPSSLVILSTGIGAGTLGLVGAVRRRIARA